MRIDVNSERESIYILTSFEVPLTITLFFPFYSYYYRITSYILIERKTLKVKILLFSFSKSNFSLIPRRILIPVHAEKNAWLLLKCCEQCRIILHLVWDSFIWTNICKKNLTNWDIFVILNLTYIYSFVAATNDYL